MNSNGYIVSLDIGTSLVRVVIGELANNTINIVGVGTSHSEGIKKGSIVDIDLTVQSIRQAVDNAERMVSLSIQEVFVGMAGNHIQLQPSKGVVAVSSPDREIGEEDIIRVIDASKVMALPPEREIIDVVPKQFIVDGLEEITDPRGMIGVRLEMEGTIITGSKTAIHNLVRCIERAGLSVAGIFLQPLATSTIALSKDEKALGIALVDIGAGQMTVSVFEQGTLMNTVVIPVGGEYITNDIAIGLKTQSDVAEQVKVKHGCALIDEALEDETFSVPRIGSDTYKEFSQVDLAHIIEPRLVEMFELVQKEVKRMGYTEVPGGYVLTGGVTAMPGVLELAKDVFQNSVRIAVPDYIGVREPHYTAAVGIIKYALQNMRQPEKEMAAAVPSKSKGRPAAAEPQPTTRSASKQTVREKVRSWFKEFI
ncbi:cell division protein FtsA [Caldalkalibacillus uzonensis]|uniref:Cell division protein FtsA n=1 Tax=Caldalkalibacillus uzonensis TaxID=353224 RepID=A0ABU0CSZ3_9BACI|nr:cell division protein FtsA [Caldalkalibacillus uzonensis]MDQ0339228.1 cell division protein FtsA [Caldalkalibacillus uzonensis]